MEDSKKYSTGPKYIDRDQSKDLKKLHYEHKEFSKGQIQKAKECIECLKFSEGLVRRDIDLIRMQLEIKLKKLESRLQAELRNMVETETAKLEKFIAEMTSLKENKTIGDKMKAVGELRRTADNIERKRLKFIANKALEKSLDDITSFGNIVLQQVSECDSSDNMSDTKNVVKQSELPNGLRRLSLDFRLPLETKQTIADGHDTGSIQTQKRPHRVSSVSSDRDYDHGKMQNIYKTRNSRQTESPDNASVNTRTASLKSKSREIGCSFTATESLNPSERHVNRSDIVNRERTSELNANTVKNPVSQSHESNESKLDKKSEDWMKADPFSVLRALKLQTSRTEENLKAIRELKHDREGKRDHEVLAHGDVKDLTSPNVSRNTASDINKSFHSNTTSGISKNIERKNSADIYLRTNRDSFNGNDPMYMEHEDAIHVDKVARANELWFGRERKRRNNSYKRRTRSLSPKTVRFYEEDTHDDILEKQDEVFLDNGNENLSSYSVRNTLCTESDKPVDNNKTSCTYVHSLPESIVSKLGSKGSIVQDKQATSKDIEYLHDSDNDDSKAGKIISPSSRNGIDKEIYSRNPIIVPGNRNYDQSPLFSEKLAETKNDKHDITVYKPLPDSVRVIPGTKRAINTLTDTNQYGDVTSPFRPTLEHNTRLDHEKRQQRLRDRRRRNRTVCGITRELITCNKASLCPNNSRISTNQTNSTEREYKSDIYVNGGSTAIEISSTIPSDISLTQSVYKIPKRRLHSEGSSCTEHTEEVSCKEDDTKIDLNVKTANVLPTNEREGEIKQSARFYSDNNTKSNKVKMERQRIPSFKEMLFLD